MTLTDVDRRLIDGLRAGVCTGPGPCDTTPIGEGHNWVTEVAGLPLYIRAIARALIAHGHPESEAIALAVGTVKRWAAGEGTVTGATRARAAKAVAEWEAKKAAAHGSRDGFAGEWGPGGPGTTGPAATNFDSTDSGSLLPRGPAGKPTPAEAHAFRGRNLLSCTRCGKPAADPIHRTRRAGKRASGAYSQGHQFYGNQYTAMLANANSPQQVDQIVAAMIAQAVHGSTTGGGGGHGGHKTAPGGAGGAGAARKAAKHKASQNKQTAAKTAAAQRGRARQTGRLKSAAAAFRSKAAHDRQLAAQAKTAAAKASYEQRAEMYTAAAVKLEQAYTAATAGHRHAGPNHSPVPTGHVAGNPVRARRDHKHTFGQAADQIEPHLHQAMAGLFDRQAAATLSRLHGSRGRAIRRAVRADPPPAGDDQPPTPPSQIPDAATIYDIAFWAAQTEQAVHDAITAAGPAATGRVDTQIGLADGTPTANSLAAVDQVLRQRANRLAGQVTDTTYRQIQDTLADGVQQGESIAQLAGRIRHVFDIAATTRAELIARTETVGALNEAAHTYASSLPDGLVGRKEWLAVHDTRTRATHRVADGQQVPLASPFLVGGTLMMHPGDPTAPPDEVCNCRCSVLYLPGPARTSGAATNPIGEAA